LKEDLDAKQRRLALREPQHASARAKIAAVRTRIAAADARILSAQARIIASEAGIEAGEARMDVAQAALDQAQNDFERTTITAPFEAQVLRRMADKGSEVSPSGEIAQLVGVQEYWVIASVPLSMLRWIRFATKDEVGSTVYIHHEAAWGKDLRRVGYVKSLIGTLDRTTRLARVVVSVADPLARVPDPAHPDRPPLIVGSLVELRIQAQAIDQIVKIDRAHLRGGNTVWVMKDGKLDIRPVVVAFEDPDHAYIQSGLEPGEAVVTTNLSTVAADAPLRTEGEPVGEQVAASQP
jgi:multidrug efflux pump subunit AcrA (membrane-fusion protein)